MPSDDELRRVAEDVRALARSLGRDLRAALHQTRDDLYGSARGYGYGPGPGSASAPEPGSASGSGGGPGSGAMAGAEGLDEVETAGPFGPPGTGRRTAREDLRAARQDLRRAQMALRQSFRGYRYGEGGGEDRGPSYWGYRGRGPGPGCAPRWDNWGRYRHRDPAGVRPGRRSGTDRPNQPPTPTEFRSPDRPPAPAPVPAPPLRHRHDGSTLLGLLALVFGLAWLVAGTHLAHVSTEAVVAVALMVLGAATVVTARTDWALSRRSWPVLGGAALAVALLALSASPNLPIGFRHLEFGARTIAPATWANLPLSIHGGFGKTIVDLTTLPAPPPADRTLSIDSAAGRLEIDVPAGLQVVINSRVAGGIINIDGVRTSGLGRVDNQVLHPSAPGPALTLDIQAGFGSVAITTIQPNASATPTPITPITPAPDPTLPPTPTLPTAPTGGLG